MLTGRNHHHGWAWAGSTPFQSTKLMAAHFGAPGDKATHNPLTHDLLIVHALLIL
jgi:hypothetical protein